MIQSPVLIIGCARSGTTLLYNILSETPSLWSIGYESKAIIERYHAPAAKAWESGVLATDDLTAESAAYITRQFIAQAAPGTYWRRINRLRQTANQSWLYKAIKKRGRENDIGSGVSSALPGAGLETFRRLARLRNKLAPPHNRVRLLEKTPENCLRLPFLAALFPDARVIYLTRDGRPNVYSLLEGWRHPHLFPGYQTPTAITSPGQSRGRWAFTLIPGWRDLVDRPLEEIAAHQWVVCNAAVLDYAARPGSLPVMTLRYEDLVGMPQDALARLAAFLELEPEIIPAYGQSLPEVNVVSAPDQDKWRREEKVISRIWPIIAPVMARLGYDPVDDNTVS
jgi:hypothetical protein